MWIFFSDLILYVFRSDCSGVQTFCPLWLARVLTIETSTALIRVFCTLARKYAHKNILHKRDISCTSPTTLCIKFWGVVNSVGPSVQHAFISESTAASRFPGSVDFVGHLKPSLSLSLCFNWRTVRCWWAWALWCHRSRSDEITQLLSSIFLHPQRWLFFSHGKQSRSRNMPQKQAETIAFRTVRIL